MPKNYPHIRVHPEFKKMLRKIQVEDDYPSMLEVQKEFIMKEPEIKKIIGRREHAPRRNFPF